MCLVRFQVQDTQYAAAAAASTMADKSHGALSGSAEPSNKHENDVECFVEFEPQSMSSKNQIPQPETVVTALIKPTIYSQDMYDPIRLCTSFAPPTRFIRSSTRRKPAAAHDTTCSLATKL